MKLELSIEREEDKMLNGVKIMNVYVDWLVLIVIKTVL
jgi:hypothetical protein